MSNSLSKNILSYGLGNILYALVVLLLVPIYLEKLDVDNYAKLTLFLISTNLIRMIFSFSVSNGILRGFYDFKTFNEKKSLYSSAVFLIMLLFIFAMIVGISFQVSLSALMFNDRMATPYIPLIVFVSFMQIVNAANQGLLRALKRVIPYTLTSIINVLTMALLNIYIIYFTEYTLYSIFLSYVVSNTLAAVVSSSFLIKYYTIKVRVNNFKYLLNYGLPLSIATLILYFLNYGNRYYLVHYSTITNVAIIDVAQKLASIIGILLTSAFMTAFTPYYLELYNKVPYRIFREKINDIIVTFSTLFLFAGLVIVLAQDIFLSLLSKSEYLSSSEYVPFIILSNYLYVLFMMLTLGTNIKKKTKIEMLITVIIFPVNILINIYSIKSYGLYGAVITQMTTNILSLLLISLYNRKYFPLEIAYKSIFWLISVFSILSFIKMSFNSTVYYQGSQYFQYAISVLLLTIYVLIYRKKFMFMREVVRGLLGRTRK